MDTNEITHTVIGACMEVHRCLGAGLPVEIYREALGREMRMREILYETAHPIPIEYKGQDLPSPLCADFVVERVLILDVRSQDSLVSEDKRMLNGMLRFSGIESGVLINFNVENLRTGVKRLIVSSKEPNVPWQSSSSSTLPKK